MLLSINGKENSDNNPDENISNDNNEEVQIREGSFTGVIKSIDELNMNITLTNIEDGQDYLLDYTGGTNFMNKYGKISVIGSMPIGEIVDATYNKDTGKFTQIKISDKAFDYQGIINWRRDQEKNGFVIAESNYKYVDNLVVSSKGQLLSVDDLDETDEITIKGFDRQIYSIIVTKGHGTLRFVNYEDFMGGIAYIGSRYILPVIEDLIVTVREGSYDVTLEIGDFNGTVPILAVEGEEVLVNMSEFKKPEVESGLVKFVITPEGADLYIDNLFVDYTDEVSIDYGEHEILVSLGGYTTYTGTVEVAEAEKTVMIDLVEASTGTDTEEEDTANSGTGEDTDNANTDDSDDNSESGGYEEVDAKNYIHVESPEGASVYFNGEFKGTAPVSFPKQTGTQYITLIKSGYTTKTYTVEVKEDNKDVKLNFTDMVIQN
ncbi:MAG: hypothetical protein K0S61_4439 [Anaerocolumna sp.]|nr:hypothetical protein [Anaerocolumna sp.]